MQHDISAFQSTQVMMTSRFEVYHYRAPYFKSLDVHSHDFLECYLFLDGSVTYYIEDQAYDLLPGDLLMIPPGNMHRPVLSEVPAVYERMVLWLNMDYLGSMDTADGRLLEHLGRFNGETGYLVHLEQSDLAMVQELFTRLIPLARDENCYSALRQQALICTLLTTVCAAAEAGALQGRRRPAFIPDILRYIDAHYTAPLTLDTIAGAFYVSKYHLSRKFREYAGATVYDYIILKRITLARKLIREGVPAAEAGVQCGFSDYANFYRTFTKRTGMTPRQFKQTCNL